MNYFELYNLPLSFVVNEQEVRKKFLLFSKQFHPDYFTLENAEKQQEVLDISTINNKAFQTLSDFDRRMKYILAEKGYLVEEERYALPQQFLMEMMELNEALMEIQSETYYQKKEEMITSINRIEQDLMNEIKPLLKSFDESMVSEKDYLQIKDFYYKKKYLLRIREQLDKFVKQ